MDNHNLILVDKYKKAISMINPVQESFMDSKYRVAQFDTFLGTNENIFQVRLQREN